MNRSEALRLGWRPAEWPKDWGKECFFSDSDSLNLLQNPGILFGFREQKGKWMSSAGYLSKFCWVYDPQPIPEPPPPPEEKP